MAWDDLGVGILEAFCDAGKLATCLPATPVDWSWREQDPTKRTYDAAWRKANMPLIRKYRAKYRRKPANKERAKLANAAYRAAHPNYWRDRRAAKEARWNTVRPST